MGPIGAHVTLNDPQWDVAVQVHLKNALNAFVVTSDRDAAELRKLFGRARMSRHETPTVLIVHPSLRDGVYSAIPESTDYTRMIDVMVRLRAVYFFLSCACHVWGISC